MITATVHQMHVPELCKCEFHVNKIFTCREDKVEFKSHKDMVETLAKWHRQQGQDACWVYRVVSVS